MKMRIDTLAISLVAAFAVSSAWADESVDCFYEANRSHALCLAQDVAPPVPVVTTERGSAALQGAAEESVDCFYEANRSHALCAVMSERIAARGTE